MMLARLWCHLEDCLGYEKVGTGYASMAEYVNKVYGKSKSTYKKITGVWRKYVEELGCDEDTIIESDYNKLSIMQSQADSDNVEDILKDVEQKTQGELRDQIKASKGLEPEEREVDHDTVELKFKSSKESMSVIVSSLSLAKEEYCEGTTLDAKKITNFQALEVISANFMLTRSLSGGAGESYQQILERFGKANGLKISWEKEIVE